MSGKIQKMINIVGSKGGSGKTLYANTLAHVLAREGYRVILIDADFFVWSLTEKNILIQKNPLENNCDKKVYLLDYFLFDTELMEKTDFGVDSMCLEQREPIFPDGAEKYIKDKFNGRIPSKDRFLDKLVVRDIDIGDQKKYSYVPIYKDSHNKVDRFIYADIIYHHYN